MSNSIVKQCGKHTLTIQLMVGDAPSKKEVAFFKAQWNDLLPGFRASGSKGR